MGLRPIVSLRGLTNSNIRQTTKNPIAGLHFYQQSGSGGECKPNWPVFTTSQARDYTAIRTGSAMTAYTRLVQTHGSLCRWKFVRYANQPTAETTLSRRTQGSIEPCYIAGVSSRRPNSMSVEY